MPINYGSTRVNDVFYGNKRVLQIYHGSNLVYNAEIGLPKGYVELEYIESTGTQYINTGIYLKGDNWRFKVEYESTNSINNKCLTGIQNGNPLFVLYNGSLYCQPTSTSPSKRVTTDIWTIGHHIIDIKTNGGYVESKLDSTITAYELGTTTSFNDELFNVYPVCVLAYWYTNDMCPDERKLAAKLYNYRIYNNDKTVCNLVPAMRCSDGTVGMYDLHRRKFLTNAGKGDFIAGNFVLPKGYDELEYIESTGTQYIDTLYKPNNNTKFYINYNVTGAAGSSVANVPYGVTNISPNVDKAGNGLFRTISGSSSFNRVAWGDETIGSNSNNSLSSHAIVYGQWVSDYYDQNEIYIDNDLVYTSTTNPLTVWNSTNNLYIFARNNQGHVDFNSAMRLKLAYATENNLYKMYLKPARKISDGTVGMYDLINNKFLTNAGSDDFIIPTN